MRKISALFIILAFSLTAYAVSSNKPESHDLSWMKRHGVASKANLSECMECHTERVSCIKCHQEVEPRSHTKGWVKKGHGLEARWDRNKCAACHTEDSCTECHTQTPPSTHRPGWGGKGQSVNRHCAGCHYPVQQTGCFTCHKVVHTSNQYSN